MVRIAEDAFRSIRSRVNYLSIEPMLEPLRFNDLSMFDLVIIGAQTETKQPDGVVPAVAPPIEAVCRVIDQAREAGCAVWCKPNLLGVTDGQHPGMLLPREEPQERMIAVKELTHPGAPKRAVKRTAKV